MRILVCGSRSWTHDALIRLALTEFSPVDTTVIHGGAPGADKIAGKIAAEFGMPVEVFRADWANFGKAAGPIRNQEMIDKGKPDVVLAFTYDLEHSAGTRDMVKRAKRANIPVTIFGDRS